MIRTIAVLNNELFLPQLACDLAEFPVKQKRQKLWCCLLAQIDRSGVNRHCD